MEVFQNLHYNFLTMKDKEFRKVYYYYVRSIVEDHFKESHFKTINTDTLCEDIFNIIKKEGVSNEGNPDEINDYLYQVIMEYFHDKVSREYYDFVVKRVISILKSDLLRKNDIVQDVFFKFKKHYRAPVDNLEAYFQIMIRNRCNDYFKEKKSGFGFNECYEYHPEEVGYNNVDKYIENEEFESFFKQLQDCLKKEEDIEIVRFLYVFEMSQVEVAKRFGTSPNNLNSRIKRIKKDILKSFFDTMLQFKKTNPIKERVKKGEDINTIIEKLSQSKLDDDWKKFIREIAHSWITYIKNKSSLIESILVLSQFWC